VNATILGYLLGAEVSLEADIESAPSAMDGTFTWSCDKAEFKQGDTWTPRMGQGKSITVRFTEPSNEHHVDERRYVDVGYRIALFLTGRKSHCALLLD